MALMRASCANTSRLRRSTDSPAISLYCFGNSPPARTPRPAATTTAATLDVIFPSRSAQGSDRLTASTEDRQNDFVSSGDCCVAALAHGPELSKLYARSEIA